MIVKKKYKIHWYNQNEVVLTEPNPIEATSTDDAISKAYELYGGKNTPAPAVYAEEVK